MTIGRVRADTDAWLLFCRAWHARMGTVVVDSCEEQRWLLGLRRVIYSPADNLYRLVHTETGIIITLAFNALVTYLKAL